MKLVLLSNDLMISSLVAGVAGQLELTVSTATTQAGGLEAATNEEAHVLVVDLRLPGLGISELLASIRQERTNPIPTVAFGPHVHEANLAKAREAGCDVVATRGQFDREAKQIIGSLLSE